jgi:hypothetical protein
MKLLSGIQGMYFSYSRYRSIVHHLIFREILASGKWILKAAKGFVLFPGSDHLETVFVFDRAEYNR